MLKSSTRNLHAYVVLSAILCALLVACSNGNGTHTDPAPMPTSEAEAKAERLPFPCDGYAYLAQQQQSELLRFNPTDGSFESRWTEPHTGAINAMGYRVLDGFFYGWGTTENRLVKISNESTASEAVEVLTDVQPPPESRDFISGDVYDDHLYLFSPTGNVHKISLDNLGPASQWETQTLTVISGNGLDVNNFMPSDVAFVPGAPTLSAYGVRGNRVVQFDLDVGTITNLATTMPFSGGFGGAYSEAESTNLFVSDNGTGNLYRIDVVNPSDTELVASSGIETNDNDGARCADAPMGKFDIHYNNHRDNEGQTAAVRAQIEGSNGAMTTISGDIGVSYAAAFNESSPEMTSNEVTPGSTKQVGFDVDGVYVDCGPQEMVGNMLFDVYYDLEGDEWKCLKNDSHYIRINNMSSDHLNPYFDSAITESPGAADSKFGFLSPGQLKIYFPGDGFLDASSINIQDGDVIDRVSVYDSTVDEHSICAADFPFDQAYYFQVKDDPAGGVVCLDFS